MVSGQKPRRGHAGFVGLTLGGALLAVACVPAASAAGADDLPGLLVRASTLIPVTEGIGGRQRCSAISGLSNLLRIPFSFGDHQTFTDGGTGYTRDTKGAYLGDAPKGSQPPLFVQALLDAGAAKRVTLTWVERTTTPTGAIPQLQDTGVTGRPGNDRPAFMTRDTKMEGDAFLVTGEDRELFQANTDRWVQSPLPPSIGGGSQNQAAGEASSPPPSVWSTAKVCVVEAPDRVLEYGDVQVRQDGVRYVSAAILFHPVRLPAWASDFRVAGATSNVFVPNDVRFITFRDDGDGWRPTPYPEPFFMRGRTHIADRE